MSLWGAGWRATLAACLTALSILGWIMMPRDWIIPVVYGLLIVFTWVNVFVWYFWLKR